LRTRRQPVPDPDPEPDPEPDSGDETNPRVVKNLESVADLIHDDLRNIKWKLHKSHQMCFIFDYVTPARQWKRGTTYSEADPWVEYGKSPWPDLTETEDEKKPQQPYYPVEHM